MNRLLAAMLTIGFAAAMVGTGTIAYFSDTEISAGNRFEALWGKADLKIDWVIYHNGEKVSEQKEPVNLERNQAIFELADVKPGDWGNGTISLHVNGTNAWVNMIFNLTSDDDVSTGDPEEDFDGTPNGPSIWDGELAENVYIKLWYDDGDGILEGGETLIFPENGEKTLYDLGNETFLLDGNISTAERDQFEQCKTYYIGFNWTIPKTVGNIIQTDRCTFDLTFTAAEAT